MTNSTDRLAADTIRVLSMDAVQRANSGHPGMPMGMADLAAVLWSKFLTVDPDDPTWLDRDRFVLSNGHGSMLLYAVLHLAGFPLTMDDIRDFRQWGSVTPGHPEIEPELGIEMTTGPLGQGFATGVGMALAEEHLRDKFGPDLVDHHTYGFVSDGDLMEGVASETASLAGHLALGRLIYLYDDNDISLVGPTSLAFSEDVPRRFDAYGWHTATIDGHDHAAIAEAIAGALAEGDRPSLISCKTHIGYGSPNKQDTAGAHGSPLGPDEIALTRAQLGWDLEPFAVPPEVYDFFRAGMDRGRRARSAWGDRKGAAFAADPELRAAWSAHFEPAPAVVPVPEYEPGSKVATRQMSGAVIQDLAAIRPDLIGGSADLASSNNSLIKDSSDFSAADRSGRNIRFGVREFGMGAMVNGITIHGGLRGYGATFLQFSDYMRGAVRLGALMGTPSIWVWTHDSIFLGEDGPTHQPVEHIAALRAIPNLRVIRPATPAEVAGAWELALNAPGPSALILSRQGVAVPADESRVDVVRGGYVARDGDGAVVVATGSEVPTALEVADALAEEGISIRVVSMPCVEAFMEQELAYRVSVIGDGLPIASLEAGVSFGWSAITGAAGLTIGIDRFGASAPADILAEHYGFTVEAVTDRIRRWLA